MLSTATVLLKCFSQSADTEQQTLALNTFCLLYFIIFCFLLSPLLEEESTNISLETSLGQVHLYLCSSLTLSEQEETRTCMWEEKTEPHSLIFESWSEIMRQCFVQLKGIGIYLDLELMKSNEITIKKNPIFVNHSIETTNSYLSLIFCNHIQEQRSRVSFCMPKQFLIFQKELLERTSFQKESSFQKELSYFSVLITLEYQGLSLMAVSVTCLKNKNVSCMLL